MSVNYKEMYESLKSLQDGFAKSGFSINQFSPILGGSMYGVFGAILDEIHSTIKRHAVNCYNGETDLAIFFKMFHKNFDEPGGVNPFIYRNPFIEYSMVTPDLPNTGDITSKYSKRVKILTDEDENIIQRINHLSIQLCLHQLETELVESIKSHNKTLPFELKPLTKGGIIPVFEITKDQDITTPSAMCISLFDTTVNGGLSIPGDTHYGLEEKIKTEVFLNIQSRVVYVPEEITYNVTIDIPAIQLEQHLTRLFEENEKKTYPLDFSVYQNLETLPIVSVGYLFKRTIVSNGVELVIVIGITSDYPLRRWTTHTIIREIGIDDLDINMVADYDHKGITVLSIIHGGVRPFNFKIGSNHPIWLVSLLTSMFQSGDIITVDLAKDETR